jgi:hypothetical protein
MNAFGSDTVLMIMPNPRKKVNAPDAILFAVHHDGKDER